MASHIRDFEPEVTDRSSAVREMPAPAGPEVAASPSDPAMLRQLYSMMLRTRMVEERAIQLAQSGKVRLPQTLEREHLASAVGSMIDLKRGDAVCSEPSVATRLISGAPLGLVFAEWYGLRSEYVTFAPEAVRSTVHTLPMMPTIAGQMTVAAGFALAYKSTQRRNVVLVQLQDGFNALGFWHEAAILAVGERLPIIIVANRKLSSSKSFGESELRDRATAYGMPGISVDGDDVMAMWRVAQESIHRARSGAGPTLIDSQIAPTTSGSVNAGDPLIRMQHYLEKRKLWAESWREELTRSFAAEIEQAETLCAQHSGKQ